MSEQPSAVVQRFRETTAQARSGDAAAVAAMSEQVYVEMKRIASAHLRREVPGHMLQPTALVHEAYLSLAGGHLDFESRAHFLALAARAMRQILVHHARARNAEKRAGNVQRVPFHEEVAGTVDASADVEALHDALENLERSDPRKAQIVELRYFGGLTEAETAAALGLSVPTVAREMRVARALLLQHLRGAANAGTPDPGA